MDANVRVARMRANEEKSFNEWLGKPETKLMLSMIPPAENQDVVQMLLRSAFEYGNSSGTANVLGELVESMFKDMQKGN